MAERVRLVEVGPRDGLQNEKQVIPSANKIRLVDALSECGFDTIEATSFVSPRWVPQLADAAEVMAGITRKPGVRYAVLTPNLKGYERARKSRADEVAVFASASESFSRKNINCSIDESIHRFSAIFERAREDEMPVRGYVSCVVECPYEGVVDPQAVARVAARLIEMGCYEVSLGDTVGKGTPETVSAMLDVVLESIQANRLAGHFHDTNHRALDNVEASLDKGLRRFDSAIGGLGGCPYAPGAKGNVATEAVVALLHGKGYETGIDEARLAKALIFVRKPARDKEHE